METPVIGVSELVAILSAVLAAFSVALNWRVVMRQIALQAEEVRAAVDGEKTLWLADTLEVFAEAETMCLQGLELYPEGEHLRLAQRFSVLADHGRISFPNLRPEERGQDNPEAYKGMRQPAIDAVILAYDLMRALPALKDRPGPELQGLLFECRRVLVSEVQRSVDPRRRAQAVEAQSRRPKQEREVNRREIRKIIGEFKERDVSVSFT